MEEDHSNGLLPTALSVLKFLGIMALAAIAFVGIAILIAKWAAACNGDCIARCQASGTPRSICLGQCCR